MAGVTPGVPAPVLRRAFRPSERQSGPSIGPPRQKAVKICGLGGLAGPGASFHGMR